MKMYIIYKDGEPYCASWTKENFVKAYFDEKQATQIAKAFCSTDARKEIDEKYPWHSIDHKERQKKTKELSKQLFEQRWKIKEFVTK